MAEAVRFLTQTVGYGGFFRGITPTLISVLPYSAVQFYAFETLTRALMAQTSPARGAAGEGKPSVSVSGVCGLAAGALAKGCTHPLDVVKKRFQVSGLPRTGSGFGAPIQSGQYANMLDCIRKVRARRPSRARVRRASAARARATHPAGRCVVAGGTADCPARGRPGIVQGVPDERGEGGAGVRHHLHRVQGMPPPPGLDRLMAGCNSFDSFSSAAPHLSRPDCP